MPLVERCPQCGEELASDAPEGLCPECLFQQGIVAQDRWQQKGSRSSPQVSPFIPPEPAELAEDFPQLEILQLLGQGGMGAVYKARQKKLDRLVALKILPLDAERDPAFAERFAREARALARLNHPNIVGVHDFGEVGGLYYFVMEYVDGVNLRQLLEAGQLTPEEALRIIPQICDALQYAHEEDIVHRDIKPENILLNKRGRVKIADFGLAKLLGAVPSAFSLTASQQVMGTPFYMAPEQMQKAHAVDHRADIYSLGVVFYEMLTGELPLGRFAPPSKKVAVDRRLDEVVFRALEREPSQRYQHISDVKNAVESIAAGNQAAPRSDSMTDFLGGVLGAKPQADGPRLRILVHHWSGPPKHGLLRLERDALFLEYDAGVVAGWFGTRYKEVRIPLEGLESVRLDKKGDARHWKTWWAHSLKIRAVRLSTLGGVPGCLSGEATFFVLREDRAAAEQFVAQMARRLPGAAAPPAALPRPWEELDVRTVERRLRTPALGLLAGGIATSIFWYVMLCAIFMGGLGPIHGGEVALIILGGAAATVGTILTMGAHRIKRLETFPFAVATAILALLPISPAWFLSCPMGIWALLELFREDTLAAFALKRQGWQQPAPEKPGFLEKPGFWAGHRDNVQRQVRWPALGLIITGIAALCFWSLVMLFGLHEAHRPGRILIAPAFGLGLAAGIILIIGGVYLKNREAYLWAVAASVLAMLPWSPAVIIGLPLGLWALLTLRRREVRAAFRHAGVGEEPNARALDEKAPTPAGPVRRKVRSFFGSLRSLIFASRVVHGPVSTQDYQPEPKSEPPSGA